MNESEFEITHLKADSVVGYTGQLTSFDPASWSPSYYQKDYEDWASMYLATTEEHAKNYAQLSGHALFEVRLINDVTLITCKSKIMGDIKIPGATKASMIKEALRGKYEDIHEGFLMDWMAVHNTIFSCQEGEDGKYEVCIPNKMVPTTIKVKIYE